MDSCALRMDSVGIREVDAQLWDAINNESKERNEVDAQLWEAVNTEYSARTEVDAQLWDAINNESKERNEVDAQKKVEGRNFDMRKHVLEYDDVMNQQLRGQSL